jgi:hypothetical protein
MITKAMTVRRGRRGPCGLAISKGYTIDFIGDTLRVSERSAKWAEPDVVRETPPVASAALPARATTSIGVRRSH